MTSGASRNQRKTRGRSRRFERISNGTSAIVTEAAALLDEELAAGVAAAKRVQARFQKERRIETSDLKDALARFQSDAHEVVTLLNDQFSTLRSNENGEIVNRFTANAHGLLDVVVEMITTGAQVANELVRQSNVGKSAAGATNGRAKRPSR
jgi:hypothetical protein